MRPQMPKRLREAGAAAVEMAIVLPFLLLVIGGLIDFGRLFYTQIVLSNAAREGARMVAMGYSATDVNQRITDAAGGLTWAYAPGSPVTCSSNPLPTDFGEVKLTVTPTFKWMMLDVVPSLFGATVPTPPILAKGSMRCTG